MSLSFFSDPDFAPVEFLDALFASSLGPTPKSQSQFASSQAVQGLQGKCTSLLTYLDMYINELTGEFETKMKDLENSSAAIGDSASITSAASGITRLEYYVGNLSSSLTSLQQDLQSTNTKMAGVSQDAQFVQSEASVQQLQQMLRIKGRIREVLEVFDTVRSLVESTEPVSASDSSDKLVLAPTGTEDDASKHSQLEAEPFSSALSLLKELILEQVSAERKKSGQNKDFMAILDGMIGLEPFFRGMTQFQGEYTEFAQFLVGEKSRLAK